MSPSWFSFALSFCIFVSDSYAWERADEHLFAYVMAVTASPENEKAARKKFGRYSFY